MAKTPLSFTASVNPASSTGSDIHDKDYAFDFGSISVGSGSSDTWVSGLVRDITVAAIAGLFAKWAWGKIK